MISLLLPASNQLLLCLSAGSWLLLMLMKRRGPSPPMNSCGWINGSTTSAHRDRHLLSFFHVFLLETDGWINCIQGRHMSSTVGDEGPQKVVAGAMLEPKRKQPLEGQNGRRRSDPRSRQNCFAGQTCARQHHAPQSSINHGMFTRTHSPLPSFRYHRARPTLELGCCFTTLLITFLQLGTVAPSSPS